jgi:hypothetical protein
MILQIILLKHHFPMLKNYIINFHISIIILNGLILCINRRAQQNWISFNQT